MADVQLPSQPELMLPTLKAVEQIGGQGHYREIDEAAIAVANITPEQLAVEFPPESTQRGPKVLQRIAWARTLLRRTGALESVSHGVWAITDQGRAFLALADDEADQALQAARHEAYSQREPDAAVVEDWETAAQSGHPHSLPVRTLLTFWGVNRRWASSNRRVKDTLADNGLRTVPDFTLGSIDQMVEIDLLPDAEPAAPAEVGAETDQGFAPLVVSHIASATNGVATVRPTDDLLKAQTVMHLNDYSQLAVMKNKHQLTGAISWESIAKARIQDPDSDLLGCLDPKPPVVATDDPLLDVVPAIVGAGFVFVRNTHNEVAGIVTTADLSDQFAGLARPFILLGEIEQWLRVCLDGVFSPDELLEYVDPEDADREVEGAHSLTLGEMERVLETPAAWDRMEWHADRVAFKESLDQVRLIRNEIMHFSPDEVADQDLRKLDSFLSYLRNQVPPPT